MIKQVEITNFRNIKHLVLDLEHFTIISGKNNLGKSNCLNAINWLFTDTLLTDKYGSGENDTSSIVPIDAVKGEHTEVSIWLNTGTKYTKILKRGYDKVSGKANKHNTEFKLNDSKSDKSGFYAALFQQLHFDYSFTALKIDEVRLFTDPLYALLKLDYKELRNLLVAMGCTVSNEELYILGFEDMRPYEAKYLGKWSNMRKSLKDISSDKEAQIKQIEAQLQLFNGLQENYDDTNYKKLLNQRNELIDDKTKLMNAGSSYMVLDIDKQINDLTNELNQKINDKKQEYQKELNEVNDNIKNLLKDHEHEMFKATKDINDKGLEARNELSESKEKLANLNLEYGSLKREIQTIELEIKKKEFTKTGLVENLGDILNLHTIMTCPICGSEFEVDKDSHDEKIEQLTTDIAGLDDEILHYQNQMGELITKANNKESEINSLKDDIEVLKKKIDDLDFERLTIIKSLSNPEEKAEELRNQETLIKKKINYVYVEFEQEQNAIDNLKNKKQSIIAESEQAVKNELEQINNDLFHLDEDLKQEYILKNNFDKRNGLRTLLEQVQAEWNDNESLLARCNEFIQTMIHQINDKARVLTGFNFVMLEENLTNGNLTEVCYVVDENNVPFKDINTARKFEMGIKFIEAVRRIAKGSNFLPILADRLEGIDDITKIKDYTNNQIICTKVSMDETITIKSA